MGWLFVSAPRCEGLTSSNDSAVSTISNATSLGPLRGKARGHHLRVHLVKHQAEAAGAGVEASERALWVTEVFGAGVVGVEMDMVGAVDVGVSVVEAVVAGVGKAWCGGDRSLVLWDQV